MTARGRRRAARRALPALLLALGLAGARHSGAAAPPVPPEDPAGERYLCSAAERVVFGCHLADGRVAAVCASPAKADGAITFQYRFGTAKHLELSYPPKPAAAADHFTLSTAPFSGGGATHLRFSIGAYDYVLFDRTVRTGFDTTNDPERSGPYSYTIHNGPGNSHDRPSRRRSRQFSQLWPSRASTKRTSMPVPWSSGSSERFS